MVLPGGGGETSTPSPEGVPLAHGAAGFFGDALTPSDHGAFGLADRAWVIPSDDPRFSSVLRVLFPAGSASRTSSRADGTPEGGAQLYLLLDDGPVESVRLSYHVRFPAGFAFVKGGKLPGMFGGTEMNGGRIPDGTDGLSTRFMWRRNGAGEVYAYLPTSQEHGTSLGRGSWTFPVGRWARLEHELRLNTPGRADGSITVWLDGRKVLSQADLVFRSTAELKIDGVFFSTFFGGDDASWSSPADQHVGFAGFELTR
ncbi:polysaccharide lyase [Nonomuraea terrae]|uniref:polysaccharide lyase n=1 Tax=Nonomuraea terrae TaxID=2530383 RepID=UPI003797A84D